MIVKQFINNPFQENTYVVWCNDTKEAALIDCGALLPAECDKILDFIEEQGLKITHLLNTHLHLDHCFGNNWASKTFGVTTEASLKDEPLFRNIKNQAAAFCIPEEYLNTEDCNYSVKELREGDEIKIGNSSLKVIETPGHSPGGISFLNDTDWNIFVGDTLFAGSVGRTDIDGGSHSVLIRSIQEKLMTLPEFTIVYCGHGPSTSIGVEKNENPFL